MNKTKLLSAFSIILFLTLLLTYQKFLFFLTVGKNFATTDFSTFSNTQISVPVQNKTTWIGIWNLKTDSIEFLKQFDHQLKTSVFNPSESFVIVSIGADQKDELAKIIDANEFSFQVLIDDQNKLSTLLWKWMPQPAAIAVAADEKILWAGKPSQAPTDLATTKSP